jgi:RNA polymerase-binding transcription factor DksA
LDDVRQILRDRENEQQKEESKVRIQNKQKLIEKALEENKNTVVGAAGIFDILGYNPIQPQTAKKPTINTKGIPTQWKNHYEKLIRLQTALENNQTRVDEDLELAWSILKKEVDKKKEISDAIERIRNKTYGICEITQEQISEDRLLAVPFARYSIDGQKELERQQALKKEKQENMLFGNDTSEGFGSSYDDREEE